MPSRSTTTQRSLELSRLALGLTTQATAAIEDSAKLVAIAAQTFHSAHIPAKADSLR